MTQHLKHCVILTMDNASGFEVYDELLNEPLLALNWKTHTISWEDKQVDWNDYDAVIIRSPWNYQDYPQAFLSTLEAIENSTAHLENSIDIVKWNIDKIYLKSLESQGVNIVDTLWESDLTEQKVADFFGQLTTQQFVIKPRISAGADNTFWLTQQNYTDYLPELINIFSHSSFMVQPFMESVINEGEFSLFYFNGTLSHTILKTPKNNDFRVQEEHGGLLTTVSPEPELVEQAEKALHAIETLHNMPLYARLDFVRNNHSFSLMEAELIEPSLYFNMDDKSASRFAKAFDERMKKITR